ncbi:MAG: septal ring lytic transglycosylase RlpA family protein [Methylotenera sp.]
MIGHVKLRRRIIVMLTLGLFIGMPTTLLAKVKRNHATMTANFNKPVIGLASYYGAKFHGKRTASGEIFNKNAMTAAHRSLPFGTQIKVTNLRNGKSVTVKVNDRGPHVRGRIVDLSLGAAKKIGLVHSGTARVRLEVLKK